MLRAKPLDESLGENMYPKSRRRIRDNKAAAKEKGAPASSLANKLANLDEASPPAPNELMGQQSERRSIATGATMAKAVRTRVKTTTGTAVKVAEVAGKGTVTIGKGVGKGTVKAGQLVGKGVGVAGKGTVKFGAVTAKATIGAVSNLPGNAIDVAKNVTNLPGSAIQGVTNLASRINMRPKDVQAAAAWKTRITSPIVKIELSLACQNLRRKDAFAECDAFAVMWLAPSGYKSEASIGTAGDESFSTLNQSSMNMSMNMSLNMNGTMNASYNHHSVSTMNTAGSKSTKRARVLRLPTSTEKEIGRTEVVKGHRNPTFSTTFTLDYQFQEEQTYVVRVYDRDLEFCSDLKEHDFLGGTVFTLGDLLGKGHSQLKRALRVRETTKRPKKSSAALVIKGQEVKSTRSVFEFRLSANSLREKDKVLDIDDNPYFQIEKLNGDGHTWETVYKSEVLMHNSNPTWAKASLPLPVICNDNLANSIKITFWNWVRGDAVGGTPLGFVETSVARLVDGASRGIPVLDVWRDHKKMFGRTKTKKSGQLKVLRAELNPVSTMLEYVSGGTNLDVMMAVDCSLHNGHHAAGAWLNDYQAATNKLGQVLEPYTRDGSFTLWGFGGDLKGERVPFFPMGDGDGTVKGAAELLDAYDTTFMENPFDMEPTELSSISPLVQAAAFRAIKRSEQTDGQSYSVLCILTAGFFGEDFMNTIDTICTAAEDAPLSIVLIGVGQNNRDELNAIKMLLANGGKMRHSNGVPIVRDVIGYASFDECQLSAGKVVAEALKDLPEQFVEYFSSMGVAPSAPLPPSDETIASGMSDASEMDLSGMMLDDSYMSTKSSRRRSDSDRMGSSSRTGGSRRRGAGARSADRSLGSGSHRTKTRRHRSDSPPRLAPILDH